MPAVSKAQHRFFEMLKHNPSMRKQKGISAKTAEDFTKNSPKGLPERKAKAQLLRQPAKQVDSDDPGDGK